MAAWRRDQNYGDDDAAQSGRWQQQGYWRGGSRKYRQRDQRSQEAETLKQSLLQEARAIPQASSEKTQEEQQAQRASRNRQIALDIKSLKGMIENTSDPAEKMVLADLLKNRQEKARVNVAPTERMEQAAQAAADAQLRKERAQKHYDEAKANLDKATQMHSEAMTELDTAKKQIQIVKVGPVRSPSKAYKHAALLVQQLRSTANVQGEQVVLNIEAVKQLEARLLDRSAWTPNRTSTPRWSPQSPPRLFTDHDADLPAQLITATEGEYEIHSGDEDVDITTPVLTNDEGFQDAPSGDAHLRHRLRQQLHPASSRRKSKKTPSRQLQFSPSGHHAPASKITKSRSAVIGEGGHRVPAPASHR